MAVEGISEDLKSYDQMEQLHAAETEIRENMDKMKDMSPVEWFQFERGIYDKYTIC